MCRQGETRPPLVGWVEKAFFTRLNKLFKIDQAKQNHVLFMKNLKVILAHPKLFVILVFPRLAPPTLVSSSTLFKKTCPFTKLLDL